MQELEDSQSDADQCRRGGVDEKNTKFRPSPNFKNMKKFIQRKIDYSESQSPSDPADQQSPSPQGNSPDRGNDSPPGQPPLPRGPPPDSLPSTSRSPSDEIKSTEVVAQNVKKEQEVTKTPKPTVCRDFIRGSCTRPGCRFAHEYDLSQLRGVYTFCHNYQNTVCTYPNCKFVHATVFEEAEFYRTGVLPPHAIAHHKNKNTVKLLPPPPPPPENSEVDRLTPRKTPVPALQTSLVPAGGIAGLSVVNCSHDMNTNNENGQRVKPDAEGNFSGSPRTSETNKQKCSNCDVYENRLRHSNQKVESLRTSIKNIDIKMAELDAQERRMNTVIRLLLDKTKNGQIQDNNYGAGPSNAGF